MRLYIGRNGFGGYEIGIIKKGWDRLHGFPYLQGSHHELIEFSGLKLAPGEIRKVKSITIEVE